MTTAKKRWRKLPPRSFPSLNEEVARADVNGEELVLSQCVTRRAWYIRWRGRTWTADAAREAVDSFLDQNPPYQAPETETAT